jgi:hypothetical protein
MSPPGLVHRNTREISRMSGETDFCMPTYQQYKGLEASIDTLAHLGQVFAEADFICRPRAMHEDKSEHLHCRPDERNPF